MHIDSPTVTSVGNIMRIKDLGQTCRQYRDISEYFISTFVSREIQTVARTQQQNKKSKTIYKNIITLLLRKPFKYFFLICHSSHHNPFY
jgi:hypothetical protein